MKDASSKLNAVKGQSGAGMVHMHMGTNRGAWLHIAAFLDAFPHRPLEDHARRVAAAEAQRTAEGAPPRGEVAGRAAPSPSLPVGNHGENLNEAQA